MSTRATVHFEEGGKVKAIVYRHTDGYREGLGKDLECFFQDVQSQTEDTRFGDATYLAAKFVVWQAHQYAGKDMLDFLSVGVCLKDPGDIEYRYRVNCDDHLPNGYPKVTIESARG